MFNLKQVAYISYLVKLNVSYTGQYTKIPRKSILEEKSSLIFIQIIYIKCFIHFMHNILIDMLQNNKNLFEKQNFGNILPATF